jgi:hypothetical protein
MALPHYTQSRTSNNKSEPIYPSLFEVTLFTPNGDDTALLLEHVKSIGGLDALNPSIDAVGQKYKFADRSFAGMPTQTFVDLSVALTLNLNDANENFIYNSMRGWYKKIYDPLTGEMGLKKDYVGSGIIVMYNRAGSIFRKITVKDIFPTGQLTFLDELNYETNDPAELSITLRCDNWVEENVGEI